MRVRYARIEENDESAEVVPVAATSSVVEMRANASSSYAAVSAVATKAEAADEDEIDARVPVAVPLAAAVVHGDEDAASAANAPMAILLNFVKVRTVDNKNFKIDLGTGVDCFESTSLERLRELIATASGTPPDNQRLIYSGRVLSDEDASLSSLGIHCGDCIILSPRPANVSSITSSDEDVLAAGMTREQSDDFWTRFSHLAESRGGSTQRLVRALNGAKLVAVVLLFYFSLSLTFMIAALIKPNDVEEEVTGEANEVHTLLPDWYVHVSEVLHPIAAVYGICVAYLGLKSIISLNGKLVRRYYRGLVLLALVQIFINVEVRSDADEKNEVIGAVINTLISLLFWTFCVKTVYRLKRYFDESDQQDSNAGVAPSQDATANSADGRSDDEPPQVFAIGEYSV